jgi:hypothetical protein
LFRSNDEVLINERGKAVEKPKVIYQRNSAPEIVFSDISPKPPISQDILLNFRILPPKFLYARIAMTAT